MITGDYYSLILQPHVSEKATRLTQDHNQYVFKVARNVCKTDIRITIEHLYNVKVKKIQIVHMRGKVKNTRNRQGRRSDWCKAYVCLAAGQQIDFENILGSTASTA